MSQNYFELVDENKFRSGLIIAIFIAFVTASTYFITYALGYDSSIVGIALIISGLMSFVSYYYSDRVILTLSGATPANKSDHFDLFTVTENLSMAAGLPMPKLFVINDSAMNAFATGRDPEHAVVCATTGIISRLNRTELEGVIAHELSHIKNYDIRLMGVVTILIGLITLLSDILLRWSWGGRRSRDENNNVNGIFILIGFALAILSPIIAQLIQLAISRRREFYADASGAALTKYPEGLASALEKLSQDKEPLEAASKATAHLYIVNPLTNRKDARSWFAGLFNTHPPIEERIKALRSL